MMKRDPYLVKIGERIRAIRQEKKVSTRKLGELCGIDRTAVSFIQTGRASAKITTLKRIADVLEVDVKDFL